MTSPPLRVIVREVSVQVIENVGSGRPKGDSLAAFGSREELLCDLATAVDPAAPPRVLAIFGLGGFHAVVASLGRPEGQALLESLAERLVRESGAAGRCYWPREDEFALLCEAGAEVPAQLLAEAAAALQERRGHVEVTAGVGIVQLPEEACDALSALRLADERLGAAVPAREPRSRRRHLRPVPDADGADSPAAEDADAGAGALRRWHVDQLLDLARTLTLLADAARVDYSGGDGLQGQPREPARIPLLAREVALKLTALRTLGGPEIPEAAGLATEAGRRPGSVAAQVPAALDAIDAALSRA
jgi:GGDEF domain-containing protein